MAKRKNNAIYTIICLAILLGGAFLLGRWTAGEKSSIDESALATVIQSKQDVTSKLESLMNDVPAAINSAGIDKYISNLDSAITNINDEEIGAILQNYRTKWDNFKSIYDNGDNEAIAVSVDELQSAANTASSDIEEILNNRIKSALGE